MLIQYNIEPMGKPRMTQRDKWDKRPCVVRYWQFCEEVRTAGIKIPENGVAIVFRIPMPKSWSNKKRAEMMGKPHQQKPDIDNLLKGLLDAALEEDCRVYHVGSVMKEWSDHGGITIWHE
jgi:Holliday junction resolvase RusA-like endonuclease